MESEKLQKITSMDIIDMGYEALRSIPFDNELFAKPFDEMSEKDLFTIVVLVSQAVPYFNDILNNCNEVNLIAQKRSRKKNQQIANLERISNKVLSMSYPKRQAFLELHVHKITNSHKEQVILNSFKRKLSRSFLKQKFEAYINVDSYLKLLSRNEKYMHPVLKDKKRELELHKSLDKVYYDVKDEVEEILENINRIKNGIKSKR